MTEPTAADLDKQIADLTAKRDANAAKDATAAHFKDSTGTPLPIADDGSHDRALLRSAGIAMELSLEKNPGVAKSWLAPDFDAVGHAKQKIDAGDYVGAMIYLAMANAKRALAPAA